MRVVWDMSHAARIRGGTGVYAQRLVVALESEHDITTVPVTLPTRLTDGAGGARKLVRGLGQVWWTQVGLAREVHRLGADLVHAPAFVASLVLPCPLVLTIHDLAYLRYPRHYGRAWHAYLRLLVPLLVRRARAVIADSHSTKGDVVRFLGVPAERVHVVHLGVDHERFRPADGRRRAAVASRYGLDGPFVLHAGALAARKNIPALIEALALLEGTGRRRRHRLVLAGEATSDLPGREAVAAAVERWGMEGRVVFLGHVPDGDLPVLYSLASVAAVPSLCEGFGLPALEAMACGTPVVASDSSSLPEVVGDAGLLVPPGDIGALADAIERAMTDTALRDSLVQRGLARAAEFTWEKTAKETAQVYRRVLAPNRVPAGAAADGEEASCSLRRIA